MLLTSEQIREFQLLHRKKFVAVCDKCGTLTPAGELYLSGKKGKTFCTDEAYCARKWNVAAATRPEEEVTVKRRMSKAEKRAELKKRLTDTPIEPSVRRAIIKTLRNDAETKFDTKTLVLRLLRQRSMREYKKGVLKSTIKGMRVKKEIRRKAGAWTLLIKEKVDA